MTETRQQKNIHRKLDFMIRWLTTDHLDAHGGYPYDYVRIGDEVVVAELDDGKDRAATLITRHAIADLLAWYDRAVARRKAYGKEPHELADVMYDAASPAA